MTVHLLSQHETRLGTIDREIDALPDPQQLAHDLFAVVDLLDNEPGLRRAFTDPAREPEDRRALVAQLLGGKVSASAVSAVQAAVSLRWSSGRSLVSALDRQAVRAELRQGALNGVADQVERELHQVAQLVEHDAGLREAVADTSSPLANRRALVDRLLQGKVSDPVRRLAARAVNARERTFALTMEHYTFLSAQVRQRLIAHVTVARPMRPEQEERLRSLLSRHAGRDVDLQIDIDPAVIGGVRVTLGDEVIEGTVAGRLEDVRRQLV